ncbi:MAG: response regulator transcription factor [Gammaproteobacteria bacterium]|jgi:two-component system response regulator QseB|nr:response regulator transcription factor [Gammaproteobacteria bacterium]
MRILLVEDDSLLGDGIRCGLSEFGYTVDWMTDGQMAIYALQNEHFDAIVLDLGLPKKSGLEVIRTIRASKINTPALILTAKDGIADRIAGLDAGADDYMTKPFDLDELAARVRAIIRRSSTRQNQTPLLEIGNISLNPASFKVKMNNKDVPISRREFTILHKLMECENRVVTRDIITQSLYGWGDDVDSNTIEVHIHNLRKKLGNGITIKTIRGIGYMIENES